MCWPFMALMMGLVLVSRSGYRSFSSFYVPQTGANFEDVIINSL